MSENNEPIFSVLTGKGSYTVSGAGDTEFNGTYVQASENPYGNPGGGILNGYPFYVINGGDLSGDFTPILYYDDVYYSAWALSFIMDEDSDMPPWYYQIDGSEGTPSRTSNWDVEMGSSPAPTVT